MADHPMSIDAAAADELFALLRGGDAHPSHPPGRRPVHVLYGGAQLFRADRPRRAGQTALAALDTFAPDPAALSDAVGVEITDDVYRRVRDKLEREPVEDLRIDFEDGYGFRPDDDEDRHAVEAGRAAGEAVNAGSLPPFVGLRPKPLSAACRARSVRTLDLFLTAMAEASRSGLPADLRITLPKITAVDEVRGLVGACRLLENALGLGDGALNIELMIETPANVIAADGSCAIPAMIDATEGRCVGAHLGPYDFTSSLGVSLEAQGLDHPACAWARAVMLAACAGRGLPVADGPCIVLPVPIHRAADGAPLSPKQANENRSAVHAGWRESFRSVSRALGEGFYQGWDVHPAQLVSRYAAVYTFFRRDLAALSARLRRFVEEASRATRDGAVFDDAATGQGMLNTLAMALGCGAIDEPELEATGLTAEQIRGRSFMEIARRGTA